MQVRASPAPGVADVARIAAIGERVIRNLQITQCYADLSAALQERFGGAANWCTFATWASRQAGSTIRGEDLLDAFERRVGRQWSVLRLIQTVNRRLLRRGLFDPGTTLGRVVRAIHTPFDAFERASDAVSEGNLKVFEEIGCEFARFIATVPPDAAPDSTEFVLFAAQLRPGPPPDGQDYLREAFAHYQQQRLEAEPGARAAWILLANLKIGLHEQTRLQPQIAAAMSAPVATAGDLGRRVLHILVPGSRFWPRLLHDPSASLVGWLAVRVQRGVRRASDEVVTEAMMVLALPGMVLRLGRNLDAPVPPVFAAGGHPALDAFVKEYDPCAGGVGDCAARDWSNLRQRMHYILHLFRAYADASSLFTPPFTADQVSRFREGVVPAGEL